MGDESRAAVGLVVSRQDWGTPWEFIHAVEERFGKLISDLACTRANAKASTGLYYDEGHDALREDCAWSELWPYGRLWLNPLGRAQQTMHRRGIA